MMPITRPPRFVCGRMWVRDIMEHVAKRSRDCVEDIYIANPYPLNSHLEDRILGRITGLSPLFSQRQNSGHNCL